MVNLMHLTRRRQDILDSGLLYGTTRYNQHGKGLSDSYPLIHAQTVRAEPCCPEVGEPVFLHPDTLKRASDEWKLCLPVKGVHRVHRGCTVQTLYLIPSNHVELEDCAPWEQDIACEDMGMQGVMRTLSADEVHDALEYQLNMLSHDDDHLHLCILVDLLHLRPCPGQPGSCRCGNIASPACDQKLCSSCCSGCSRHPQAAAVQQQEQDASLEESHGYVPLVPVQPQQPQQQYCTCGKPAAGACVGLHCKECCGNYSCRRHFPDGPPAAAAAAAATPAAPQRPLTHTAGMVEHWSVYAAAAQPSPSGAQQAMSRVGGGEMQPMASSSARSSSTVDTVAARTDHGRRSSSSTSSATQAIRERMLAVLTEYLSSGAVLHQRSCDVEPLMGLMDLALDSAVWQQAEAEGLHSSSNSNAGNRPTSSSKAAARGSLSVEEQLHQVTHCVVCMDAPRTVVLLPCKHLVLCQACSKQLQQMARDDATGSSKARGLCPVCRVPAAQHMAGVILS